MRRRISRLVGIVLSLIPLIGFADSDLSYYGLDYVKSDFSVVAKYAKVFGDLSTFPCKEGKIESRTHAVKVGEYNIVYSDNSKPEQGKISNCSDTITNDGDIIRIIETRVENGERKTIRTVFLYGDGKNLPPRLIEEIQSRNSQPKLFYTNP